MKTKIASLAIGLLFISFISASAQTSKTESFKVYGNCENCKKRIEKAANSVDGVSKASWDDNTKLALVTYDPAKTTVQKVQVAIAKVGHDTETEKAPDKAYNKLPECCKYERKKETKL